MPSWRATAATTGPGTADGSGWNVPIARTVTSWVGPAPDHRQVRPAQMAHPPQPVPVQLSRKLGVRCDAGSIRRCRHTCLPASTCCRRQPQPGPTQPRRSEEHTSELQSRRDLVCRLLLEKKKKKIRAPTKETKTKTNHKT